MIIELNGSFIFYRSLRLCIYIWKITSNYFYNVEDFEEKSRLHGQLLMVIICINHKLLVYLKNFIRTIMFTQSAIKNSAFAVSLEKRKRKKKSINVAKSKPQKVPLNALNEREKFSANCGICKKRQRKVCPKYQYPKPIRTTDAERI